MSSFPPEYVATLREALSTFHAEAARLVQDHGSIPAPGSKAETEQATGARPVSIVSAWSLGTQLIEFGGEHLTAFVKTITEPMEVIACWTCVRSMLESCALSAWLLDPAIDAQTRIGRVFALRYEGMEQQLKFGRATNRPANEITDAEDRINKVEQDALAIGFAPVLDKHNRRIGIALRMPNATDMIQTILDEGIAYRLLSGVAHGHSWAITGLGYKPAGPDVKLGGVVTKPFDKTDSVTGIAYLGVRTAKSFARPLWNQCRYFGWDEPRLEELFETIFDKLQTAAEVRFWRSASPASP